MRFREMVAVVLIAGVLSSQAAWADTHVLDREKSEALLATEAANGMKVPSKAQDSDKTRNSEIVNKSVGVTAVLLTQGSIRRLFGAEIAKTYAAVQLTISNKNPDAAFILHSAYIDTSQWAAGGGSNGFQNLGMKANTDKERARSGNSPNQISSVEARLARGQMLDAQQWSARNWTVRLLTVAGSVAAGYSFAFNGMGVGKGIAAFNGNVVPGVAMAWPDGVVPQLNRISDFGFQTNKVIGKDSSDVMVCFFPIDMLLSPGFRKIFLKSPAVFLSPFQLLLDKTYDPTLKELGIADFKDDLKKLQPCFSKGFEPAFNEENPFISDLKKLADKRIREACATTLATADAHTLITLDFLSRFGLQNIGVFVDGIMTIDLALVPASIDGVSFEGDSGKADFWSSAGEKKGSVLCRFCPGGTVNILNAANLGITNIKTTPGEDDKHLSFSFTLTKPMDVNQTLDFVIVKKSDDPKKGSLEVKSPTFPVTISYSLLPAALTAVTVQNGKVTIAGTGLLNTATNKLTVALHAEDGKSKDVSISVPDSQFGDTFTFNVPADLGPGCWIVDVRVGTMKAAELNQSSARILIAAKPTLTSATQSAGSVTVVGTDLIDTSNCDGGSALKFQLLKTGSVTSVDVTATLQQPTGATFKLPTGFVAGQWTVRVLQGGAPASTVDLK